MWYFMYVLHSDIFDQQQYLLINLQKQRSTDLFFDNAVNMTFTRKQYDILIWK